jgi:hypothetical protein
VHRNFNSLDAKLIISLKNILQNHGGLETLTKKTKKKGSMQKHFRI